MFDVTMADMRAALDSFEIEDDSIILTHSSLKAAGIAEGGADGVIKAIMDTVPNGTIVFPTLSQKNWSTVYQDWHLNRPSDVGLISETFRRDYSTHRSDNATHSVAARGKLAKEITDGHALPPERFCLFGNYAFSDNSPWQRMYSSRTNYGVRAYVLFWGVNMRYNTLKHLAEARFVEYTLSQIRDNKKRDLLKSKISHYPYNSSDPDFLWLFYSSENFMTTLEEEGLLRRAKLGKSELILCDIFESTVRVEKAMIETPEKLFGTRAFEWIKTAKEAAKND